MSSSNNDDDFVTKTTKHRKKMTAVGSSGDQQAAKKPPVATNGDGGGASAGGASAISLRPRTMFAMKGRGRTESEGSAYRPQWSKDGEGFVSATGAPASFKDAATGGGDAAGEHRGKDGGERRKSKVLRYTKEELLALHFTTSEPPEFPPETMVASEHALPPVGTLPFDYEEIYKQWSLNRNRGRGRGRGAAPPGGLQGTRGHSDRARGDGKWEEGDGAKHRGDDHREGERDSTWQRGARVTENSRDGGDVWDDVLEAGTDSNEMDLSSMAEAAEKFRREMDAMRDELQGSSIDPEGIKDDLDAFDKKLEDAAAAGQFDDSDNEETQWDDALEPSGAGGSLEPQNPAATRLSGQTNSGGLFDALEPAGAQFALEEKSSFSLPQLPVDDHLSGMPSMHAEVEDEWFYLDPQGLQQGPFKTAEMREWFEAGYFKPHLPIRFGREGAFTALASQFVHGQMPFAEMPHMSPDIGSLHIDPRQSEHQRLLELQHEQLQRERQQQQMMQLQQQQQQQQQRLLQEEKIRMEMQRLEMARQQQQTQLYQQQQMLLHQQQQQRQQQQQQQQQQQHMLLQQQSSWQRSQREGIMSALGIFGGSQDSGISTNDSFRPDGMQLQFQSDFRTQHELSVQNAQTQVQDSLENEGAQRGNQAFWANAEATQAAGAGNIAASLGGLDPARPSSPIAPETAQLPTPTNANPPVVDAWGVRPTSPADTSLSLHEIQNQEKRRAVENVRSSLGGSDDQTSQPQALDGSGGVQQQRHNESSPVKATKKEQTTGQGKEKKTSPNVAKKNGKNGESTKREANAWTDGAAASAPKASNNKSLKSIQHEEQREMRNKMAGDASGTADLAQMGAQLKMMLGVESTAVAPGSSPAPAAKPVPAPKPMPSSMPAPPAAPVASPWGTPAVASQADLAKKQSLRDILAEEERLAHERAKANEAAAASSSSHWMNIVAGNTVASAAIPKPSRSSLGPVPASVLKSRQQIRANGAKASPAKVESDASFWNFGAAAQSVNKESVTASSANAFGSSSVSSEFMAWASKQLSAIDANANVTLLEYCASVEDPGEIREYLAAYLGSTPRVSAFATEFIQRKKAQNGGKKSPGRQDADQRAAETGSSNKRGKRRPKNQKIDPSLLSYSVGS